MPRECTVENRTRFPGNLRIARIHIHEKGTPPSRSAIRFAQGVEPNVHAVIDFNWGLTQASVDAYVARRAQCITTKS